MNLDSAIVHPDFLATPAWDSCAGSLLFTCNGGHQARFKVSVEINGNVLAPATWETTAGGEASSLAGGFEIRVGFKPVPGSHQALSAFASITNRSGTKASLGAIRFSAVGTIFPATGPNLRAYKEAWCMFSPAVSVRYGDSQSLLNPGYKAFGTPDPVRYDSDTPNRFFAEYAVVLNDKQSGNNMLLGFISSESQVARFTFTMNANGLSSFEAICEGDNIEIAPGECVTSEELVIMAGTDGYALLETFADLWGARMKAISWHHTPTGWCSWPYYFERITEADMIENVKWLQRHTRDFPVEYIQMDDGYQSARGDWLVCNKDKFPNGLQSLAGEIKSAGFKPGIWLAPFLVNENSQLYASHPEWTVKNQNAQTVWVMPNVHGIRVAALDCTRPEVCAWLTDIFATLAGYGYEYFKIDFLAHQAGAIAMGGRYSDARTTRLHATRRGLQAIRRGIGDGSFLLGCTNLLGAGVGIVNASRIGSDFLPAWNHFNEPFKEAPTLPNVLRNIINRSYMHQRLWLNDSDTHLARIDNSTLTEDEVKMHTAAIWITGGLVLAGDRFSTLDAERGKLSQMLLKDLESFENVRPMDLFDAEYPSLWFGKSRKNPGQMVIGAFNFDENTKIQQIDLGKAGINSESKFKLLELWSKEDLGEIKGAFQVEMKAHSSKVFLLSVPFHQ